MGDHVVMAGLRPVKVPVHALIREPGPPFTGAPNRCRGSAITNMSQVGTPAAGPARPHVGSEDPDLDG